MPWCLFVFWYVSLYVSLLKSTSSGSVLNSGSTPFFLFNLGLLFCFFWVFFIPRYWHRSLNPRKLVEVKFSHLSRNMTLQRTMKLYRLPDVNTYTHKSCISLFLLIAGTLRDFHFALSTLCRAPRLQVCGRWKGATSVRLLNCYRDTWDVSNLLLLWERRRWLTGSYHRTT